MQWYSLQWPIYTNCFLPAEDNNDWKMICILIYKISWHYVVLVLFSRQGETKSTPIWQFYLSSLEQQGRRGCWYNSGKGPESTDIMLDPRMANEHCYHIKVSPQKNNKRVIYVFYIFIFEKKSNLFKTKTITWHSASDPYWHVFLFLYTLALLDGD